MAIAFVQQNTATSGTGTAAAALTSVAAGNFLIAMCTNSSGSTNAFTVTDDKTQTWTRAAQGFQTGAGNSRIEIWYCHNSGAGTTTITATSAGSSSTIAVQEYSGVMTSASLDVAAGGGNATATTFGSVGQATTNANNLLLVGVNYNTVSGTNTATDNNNGAIWTANSSPATSSQICLTDRAIVAATSTYSNNWTVGTTEPSGWVFASFKAAVVGGGSSNAISGISKMRDF